MGEAPDFSALRRHAAIGAVVLMVAAVGLGPRFRPWILVALVGLVAFIALKIWDETRGVGARLRALRGPWLALPDVVASGGDLHFREDGQPLIARLAVNRGEPTVAILTPLPESSTAFVIKAAGTPPLTDLALSPATPLHALPELPGLATLIGHGAEVRGNSPHVLARWLDQELLTALRWALTEQKLIFCGLTLDGRFLAVHWRGEPARDPELARTVSAPLWRAFVPRLPPRDPADLN